LAEAGADARTILAIIVAGGVRRAMWREHLFALMTRNARTATSFFRLPPNRVVELGAQIEL
jgi:K+ transporter